MTKKRRMDEMTMAGRRDARRARKETSRLTRRMEKSAVQMRKTKQTTTC